MSQAGYIADFYCAAANLVIELDGSQHAEQDHRAYDVERDRVLEALGLTVLRFDNRQVLFEIDAVMSVIFSVMENPTPTLPLKKGGSHNPLCKRGSAQPGGFVFAPFCETSPTTPVSH
jgi:Protein of unknown function (DUF559)